MPKPASESYHASNSRWRRLNRRALRLAALSFLLPVPVAFAAPQSLAPQQFGASSLPVTGVGDTVLPQVLPATDVRRDRAADERGPVASMTRLERQQAAEKASEVAANGIPKAAFRAYRTAEATMGIADPSCRLSWGLLAGIGRIESDHGRYGGAMLARNGQSTPQIVGLPLNGEGAVAAIADTDGGSLDGDKRWDRAVGPMQFIPSTWSIVGVDGDADGKRNPHDLDDAALAAAAYLCVGDRDLSTAQGVHDALFSYNHSEEYVALVSGVAHAYQSGAVDLPLLTATLSLPTGPGLQVGVGSPGTGTQVGGSDEVTRADRRAERADEPRAGKRNADDAADDARGDRTRDDATDSDDSAGSEDGPKDGSKASAPKGDDEASEKKDRGGKKRSDDSSGPGKGGGSTDDDAVEAEPGQPEETEASEEQREAEEKAAQEAAEEQREAEKKAAQEAAEEQREAEKKAAQEEQEKAEEEVVEETEAAEYTGTVNTDCGSPLCLLTEDGNYSFIAKDGYNVEQVITVMAILEDGTLIEQ